jgi:hypothetical protein
VNLLELHYQQRKARTEAHALLDLAVTEGRNLSLTEKVKFDLLLARCKEIDASIVQRENIRKMAA